MCVEVIVCNVSVVFFETVYLARSASLPSGLNKHVKILVNMSYTGSHKHLESGTTYLGNGATQRCCNNSPQTGSYSGPI